MDIELFLQIDSTSGREGEFASFLAGNAYHLEMSSGKISCRVYAERRAGVIDSCLLRISKSPKRASAALIRCDVEA